MFLFSAVRVAVWFACFTRVPTHQGPKLFLHPKVDEFESSFKPHTMRLDRSWFKPSRRRNRLLLVALVVLAVLSYLHWSHHHVERARDLFSIDILQARRSVKNPIYSDMSAFANLESDPCIAYFDKLSSLSSDGDILDLEAIHSHTYDIALYKRSKWVREQEKALRHQMVEEHKRERWGPKHDAIIQQKFVDDSMKLVNHEKQIIRLVNHMRIYNRCFVDRTSGSNRGDSIEKKIYPWINEVMPTYQHWNGKILEEGKVPVIDARKVFDETGTPIQRLKKMSNGKGIVIPILPSQFRKQQIEEIQGLIRVFRAGKNTLPIQIVYRKEDLNQEEMKLLVSSARTEIRRFPYPYDWFHKTEYGEDAEINFMSSRDYPKQDLWFVDLSGILNEKQHPQIRRSPLFVTHTFSITLAAIFNSFEEYILLLSSSIILKLDIKSTFEDPQYMKYGLRFFKSRSDYDSKQRKSPPGFREISSLIREYLMPSKEDSKLFGLHERPGDSPSSRIFDHDFQLLQDPTVMVVDKSKVLSGLLLSANLQLYPLLHGRFPVAKEEVNPEYFWLGQEIAGTNAKVNFNQPFAVVAGIQTPLQNRNFKLVTTSHELCSSSWAQLDPQDESQLLYVTSHQLENYYLGRITFRQDIALKYTSKEKVLKDQEDGSRVQVEEENTNIPEKLERNPLFMEEILRPLDLLKPIIEEDFREPRQSWYKQNNFGHDNDHPFWCAYDIVGSPNFQQRGLLIPISEKLQARYNFLVEVHMYKLESLDD